MSGYFWNGQDYISPDEDLPPNEVAVEEEDSDTRARHQQGYFANLHFHIHGGESQPTSTPPTLEVAVANDGVRFRAGDSDSPSSSQGSGIDTVDTSRQWRPQGEASSSTINIGGLMTFIACFCAFFSFGFCVALLYLLSFWLVD